MFSTIYFYGIFVVFFSVWYVMKYWSAVTLAEVENKAIIVTFRVLVIV